MLIIKHLLLVNAGMTRLICSRRGEGLPNEHSEYTTALTFSDNDSKMGNQNASDRFTVLYAITQAYGLLYQTAIT